MTLVVDANIAVLWTFESPLAASAVRLLRKTDELVAPDLIVPEVANSFYKYAKMFPDRLPRIMDGLEFLPRWFSELVPSVVLRSRAFELALELQHPTYDCFYLALALERDVKLVTADTHFHRKAAAAGYQSSVSLLDEWAEA